MSQPKRHRILARISITAIAFVVIPLSTLAQTPPQPSPTELPKSDSPTQPQVAPPTDRSKPSAEAHPTATDEEIEQWIEELGSSAFADRERAASRLSELGQAIIPRLTELGKEHHDPEVRIRANKIVRQLTAGDLNRRIEAFLSGKDVGFEGWDTISSIFGDSNSVREMFVELVQVYPDLTVALDGTSRDRAMALERAIVTVRQKMTRDFPSVADTIALLLPSSDPAVPLNNGFDDLMLSVLYKPAIGKMYRDPNMATPTKVLVGRWLPRSKLKNREEILMYGMTNSNRYTYDLAIKTFEESDDAMILASAIQAVTVFGDEDDAERLADYLDDDRVVSENGFYNGKPLRVELGDAAMAAIARLHDMSLKQVGFPTESVDERFGFALNETGFIVGDDESRSAARKKIEMLVRPTFPIEPFDPVQ